VLLALSGGADSVFLLQVLAAAQPRPRILAVHVDHRLRGEESEGDAAFCARLCARLGVPFARREVDLDPQASNLEARAREARYRALGDEARSAGLRTVLTGHHEDDALETLLLRWMRGSDLPGLAGLKARNVLGSGNLGSGEQGQASPVQVVRPLLTLRREEVRTLLRSAGVEWREDSSNADPRFTRNRVRGDLLPQIERACGPQGVEGLRAFAGAVERLENELAGRTAHLAWTEPGEPSPGPGQVERGQIERAKLEALAAPLVRRALWRLLSEGTGLPPSRALLAILEDDLTEARVTRRDLPGGWTLHLRKDSLLLAAPAEDGRTSARGTALAPRETGDLTGSGPSDRRGVFTRDDPAHARQAESTPEGSPPA
jgi:tRNA(Ile)-lysidine synthase